MAASKKLGLTVKQEKFCNVYIETGNASEAYRAAYNTGAMKVESIHRKAFEVLENVNVSARIRELQEDIRVKSDITKEKVLNEYAKIAFSSIAHLQDTWVDLKTFSELTDEQKACIKNISTKVKKVPINEETFAEVEFVKIELYDKLKALDSISQMLGYNAPIKTENSVVGNMLVNGITVQVVDSRTSLSNSESTVE